MALLIGRDDLVGNRIITQVGADGSHRPNE